MDVLLLKTIVKEEMTELQEKAYAEKNERLQKDEKAEVFGGLHSSPIARK